MNIRKVSFPHMGNYHVAFKPVAKLLGDEVIVAPPITKKTVELGCKYSPEAVCIPFKYNLGNYIEALDMGANVLIQAGGGCRYGYYGEIQEEILKKMGYKFDFVKINNKLNPFEIVHSFKKINPSLSYRAIVQTLIFAFYRITCIDAIEKNIRKNIGFQKNKGELENFHKKFLRELDSTVTVREVKSCEKKYLSALKKIEIQKPDNPIRVGVVGEFYVTLEPFSNFYLERELGRMGVEVHRFIDLSAILRQAFLFKADIAKFLRYARPYLTNHIGAHGTESVGLSHKLIKQGFNGIIHIKPFGCMPEANAMFALQKMSKDFKIPIIYFSFDSLTSETGMKTRIEAFYDMLIMKQNKTYGKNN